LPSTQGQRQQRSAGVVTPGGNLHRPIVPLGYAQ
jgi:hypothetical protein